MPEIRVTVAIPTLEADATLAECIQSLKEQTRQDFAVVVVDNSGQRLARRRLGANQNLEIIENDSNRGFGAAVNQVYSGSSSPFLATLNDDAVACPRWLDELLTAVESDPQAGMGASQVRLRDGGRIDSAGMLICGDGSSKQRGHQGDPADFGAAGEVLLPSGSAALYRRAMLDEIGGFDEDFFLYCEDTDLGLRARWAGWKCLYAPRAIVEHRYSHSAGRASPLKAFYVERNRLFTLVKNFPALNLLAAPWISLARYAWHVLYLLRGEGAAAQFQRGGQSGLHLVALTIRAHLALVRNWTALLRKRRAIRASRRMSPSAFRQLLRSHAISAREVARL